MSKSAKPASSWSLTSVNNSAAKSTNDHKSPKKSKSKPEVATKKRKRTDDPEAPAQSEAEVPVQAPKRKKMIDSVQEQSSIVDQIMDAQTKPKAKKTAPKAKAPAPPRPAVPEAAPTPDQMDESENAAPERDVDVVLDTNDVDAPTKPIKLLPVQPTERTKQLELFFSSTMWVYSCSKKGCECKLSLVDLGHKKCRNCEHSNHRHIPKLKKTEVRNDSVGGVLTRIFALVKAIRGAVYTFQLEKWAKQVISYLTTEVQEIQVHILGRGVSGKLKSLLEALRDNSAQIAALELPSPTKEAEAKTRVSMICAADAMFYSLYYYSITSKLGIEKKLVVDKPAVYFVQFELVNDAQQESLNKFLGEVIDERTRDLLETTWHFYDENQSKLPELLQLRNLKLKETVELFYRSGLFKNGEMSRVVKASRRYVKPPEEGSKIKMKARYLKHNSKAVTKEEMEEPLCDSFSQAWRDNCRDWISLLYSYAIPTPEALQMIAKYGPIIEAGAGTGYWASLLKKKGVAIECIDSAPPAPDAAGENEFHANAPTFVPVAEADVVRLVTSPPEKALFICYPPPNDTMALNALQYFTGETFIYIGEWQGFTATSDFEMRLLREYKLEEKLDLPNWPDTTCVLSIWKRNPKAPQATPPVAPDAVNAPPQLLSCDRCGVAGQPPQGLRRCRICRLAYYCSEECELSDQKHHKCLHALQMVFVPARLKINFKNPNHFARLKYVVQ